MIPNLTHAEFVWSSYAIFLLVVAWQFLQPLLKRRSLITHLSEAIAERRAARRTQS